MNNEKFENCVLCDELTYRNEKNMNNRTLGVATIQYVRTRLIGLKTVSKSDLVRFNFFNLMLL